MVRQHTVAVTAESHLCLSCGICTAICPQAAIVLAETADGRLVPRIDENVCRSCGHCLSICPGLSITGIENILHGNQPFVGSCIDAYVAHATDQVFHSHGQSGGVAAAIALNLLESGRIEGIVVSRLDWDGGKPRGRAFIARNRDELLSSQGSKYCPMPLFEALNSEIAPSDRLAVVGLPCHVHAIHNLRKLHPDIAKPIILTIGLFCDRTLTYAAMDYLAQRANLRLSDIKSFAFRDKIRTGYPGDVCIFTKDGRIKALPNTERMKIKEFFTPLRCRFCFDKLNVFSDITIGDPYGVDGSDSVNGESVLLARTEAGGDIARLCIHNNVLQARAIDYECVISGQGIEHGKMTWHTFVKAWQELGGPLPTYTKHIGSPMPDTLPEAHPYAAILVRTLNQQRCKQREELLQSAHMSMGECEPYFGCIADRHYIIEIMGCGFVNKGAMMMLMAIVKQIKRHLPEAKIAASPMPQMKLFLDYDVLPMLPGFIDSSDLNVVLDASGFAYSDEWGLEPSRSAALKFEKLKSYGVKLFLLPQAFGPFRNPAIGEFFKRIVAAADLVFARDRISLEHARSVVGDDPKIAMAPDFTTLLEPLTPSDPGRFTDKVCIVPNIRMIDKTSRKKAALYADFLKNTVLVARELGRDAFFLIHEGHGDFEIAQQVNALLDKKCALVREYDPLLLKGIIGASAVVVSSRYHALIGSLSQAVPSVCAGWSHKYHELFKEYGFPEGVMDLDSTKDHLRSVLSSLLDCATRGKLIAHLSSTAVRQKEMAREMWQKVFNCVTVSPRQCERKRANRS